MRGETATTAHHHRGRPGRVRLVSWLCLALMPLATSACGSSGAGTGEGGAPGAGGSASGGAGGSLGGRAGSSTGGGAGGSTSGGAGGSARGGAGGSAGGAPGAVQAAGAPEDPPAT